MNIVLIILLLFLIKLIYHNLKEYNYATKIENNLWLGNKIASLDTNFLKKNNIKLIINCSKNLPFTKLANIKKYRLKINDDLSVETQQKILLNIDEINVLINKYLNNNKGVLIHCKAGKQRAPTVMACYLINKYNLDYANIIKYIKQKRKSSYTPKINYFNTIFNYYKIINNNILR